MRGLKRIEGKKKKDIRRGGKGNLEKGKIRGRGAIGKKEERRGERNRRLERNDNFVWESDEEKEMRERKKRRGGQSSRGAGEMKEENGK